MLVTRLSKEKNNYELKVMNGDQGTILQESGQHLMVEFDGQEIAFEGLQKYDLDLPTPLLSTAAKALNIQA